MGISNRIVSLRNSPLISNTRSASLLSFQLIVLAFHRTCPVVFGINIMNRGPNRDEQTASKLPPVSALEADISGTLHQHVDPGAVDTDTGATSSHISLKDTDSTLYHTSDSVENVDDAEKARILALSNAAVQTGVHTSLGTDTTRSGTVSPAPISSTRNITSNDNEHEILETEEQRKNQANENASREYHENERRIEEETRQKQFVLARETAAGLETEDKQGNKRRAKEMDNVRFIN